MRRASSTAAAAARAAATIRAGAGRVGAAAAAAAAAATDGRSDRSAASAEAEREGFSRPFDELRVGPERSRAGRAMSLPRIAITAGDPAGIGPEIAARAAADRRVLSLCQPIVYESTADGAMRPGQLSAAAGRAAYDTI